MFARLLALTICLCICLGACLGVGQRAEAADHFRWSRYASKPNTWYEGSEGKQVLTNILAWQTAGGSWPKNVDTATPPPKTPQRGTFDNGATRDELRLLSRAFRVTGEQRFHLAFLKGFDHILAAQYPNGGWPQFSPPGRGYNRHITFNDGAMVGLMNLLREIASDEAYDHVDTQRRELAQQAFDRGVACILKCQIKVDGRLTAWCAQHDHKTLEPRKARTYEHISISGGESAGIVQLLMSLEKPSSDVARAVNSACTWFEAAQLSGIRQQKDGGDLRVVTDADAPPIWARFYEIGTNRPIFSDRDGVIKYDVSQIGHERRNGYAWYGTGPINVLAEWPKWRAEHGE